MAEMEKEGELVLDAIFFDFDGVVLDSVHLKTEAFGDIFAQYGEEIRQQVVDYHLQHGGVSRFEKFKYYYRELLNKPVSESELQKLGERFTQLTLEKIIVAPFIDGAQETLAALNNNQVPCFVASGTPQDDLDYVLAVRSLGSYFVEAHGSPRKKVEIVKDVAERFNYNLSNCLFIGDAMTDYNAAKVCGMPFLGVKGKDSADFPEGTTVTSILSYEILKASLTS